MRQPEGFVLKGKEDYICKLNKGVYGLKQSGCVWHQTLKSKLKLLGFKTGIADETIFFRTQELGDTEIAGWYVDDGLLATRTKEAMDKLIMEIGNILDIQDLGEPTRLLGIKISRNRANGMIHISQPAFINTITKRFKISPGKSINSPVLEPMKLLVFGMHMQSPKSFYHDVMNKKRYLILCCSTTPEIIQYFYLGYNLLTRSMQTVRKKVIHFLVTKEWTTRLMSVCGTWA